MGPSEAGRGANTTNDVFVRRIKNVNHICGEGAFYDAGNNDLFSDSSTLAHGTLMWLVFSGLSHFPDVSTEPTRSVIALNQGQKIRNKTALTTQPHASDSRKCGWKMLGQLSRE